ncbi:MAG: GHKL domain-containing protein [Bacteroidales bacterium]|jgi:signal transduction histidine kinase|nr:GHKL domain-containing protein [Bacteroidales bacterium]
MIAKPKNQSQPNLLRWLFMLLIASAVVAVFYNWIRVQYEHRNRLEFAEILLKDNDTEALQLFEIWRDVILSDSAIFSDQTTEVKKTEYLQYAVDSIFSDNYNVSLIVCDNDDSLLLEDDVTIVSCGAFFKGKILQQGRATTHPNLFEVHRTPFDFNYLGFVKISEKQTAYVEFVAKERVDWFQNTLSEKGYSVAFYDHSELVKQIGAFYFPLKFFVPEYKPYTFTDYESSEHLLVSTNDLGDETVFVISRRIPNIQTRLSTFSFVFLLSFFIGLAYLFTRHRSFLFTSFAQRLQLTILSIVFATFAGIGITSVIYVQRLNAQKNQKVLREKTYSLLLLMELRFGDQTPAEILKDPDLLQRKLTEFSSVFFTDIFFYDALGQLIAKSSLDEVLKRPSRDTMDAQAFYQLNLQHKNFYIQKETLNDLSFYSSYVPFRNNQNELAGYLNIPHFAKQTELRQEISAFVRAYINLFVGLIIVAFTLVFLIMKRLTKPLVDSERQMAWTEMAKQIAHEIKNPLTPMKLNVQQIQKAHNDQKEDFDERLKRFSTVMIEQIDTLSSIASEFANFAKQTNGERVEVDVKTCLEKAVLLMNTDHIIHFEIDEPIENTSILADEKQLYQAFINVLKNARQAVNDVEYPHIRVSLSTSKNHVTATIQDNGKGISPDVRSHIFEPNFTTKTSGMGLGLAITKNIIERFGGTISFESNENGTAFFVQLPRA